jgi:TetR/AcrR family transcriptional regulator, transcriptional repressor for nem operon
MGRNRAFDSASALTGAMMAFREHGYAGASVRAIERATNVSVGSLYNAFGDKPGLYRAAFEHYFRTVIETRLVKAESLEDLEAAFLALFAPPMNDGFGCMVVNGAMEFGGSSDAPAADLIARGLDTIETSFARVLQQEVGGRVGHAVGRLGLIYRGLMVAARSAQPLEPYRPVILEEFARLRELRNAI